MNSLTRSPRLERMQQIFNTIQTEDSKVYSDSLKEILQMLSANDLFEDFCKILNAILLCKRQTIPAKIIMFIKRIFEDLSETPAGSEFILGIFGYLTRLTESKVVKVRKNSLFIIKLIIDIPDTKINITPEFLSKICEKLFDKEKNVRKEALRVLSNHQHVQISSTLKVLDLFKEITRYDPSYEIRLVGLSTISIEKATYNCVIERSVDLNDKIRKLFYSHCLPKIQLKDLSQDRRLFLMSKALSEREFETKNGFVDACMTSYNIPDDLKVFITDFYDVSTLKYFEELLFEIFKRTNCKVTADFILNDLNDVNTFLLKTFLTFTEENYGRDELNLPPLESFVELTYSICMQAIEKHGEDLSESLTETIKNLFRIIRFYDFFTEEASKVILKAIYKLLIVNTAETIVEEAMKILDLISTDDLNGFLGGLIKKSQQENPKTCLLICKHIMKHIKPFTQLHDAILSEIVLGNIEKNEYSENILEIGFFYVLEKQNDVVTNYLLSNIENEHIFHMCIDFSIFKLNSEFLQKVENYIISQIDKEDEKMIIPLSKLILSKVELLPGLKYKFVEFAFIRYYNTNSDHLKQYVTVLFFELFNEDSTPLIEVFCNVLTNLDSSEKVFIDQALYWISNSKHSNGSQELFYKICLHLVTEFESISNKKIFFSVIDKIEIMPFWDKPLLKKILFCCSALAKKTGNKYGMGEIVSGLLSIDDGEPINQDDLIAVKKDLGLE